MKLLIMRGSSQYVNPSYYNVQEIGLAKELIKHGWQVRIISSGPHENVTYLARGIEWVECKRIGPTNNIGWPRNSMRYVREFHPDLVQVQDMLTPTTFISLWASLSQRTKLVMSMGEYPDSNLMKDAARRLMSMCMRKRISAVLCKTNAAAKMCSVLGFNNVAVCPVGIDPECYSESYSVEELPWLAEVVTRRQRGQKILSHVGRIDKLDNMKFIARIVAELPEEFALLVAGQPVSYGEEVSKGFGVEQRMIFAGAVPNRLIGALFHSSDLYLSCSTFEPFGLSAVESLYHGCPVIAHPTGGIVEIVTHDVTGLLVPVRTPQAWAAAIRKVIDDCLYERYRTQIQHRNANLTWTIRAHAYDKVYRRVLDESGCSRICKRY